MSGADLYERRMRDMLSGVSPAARALLERHTGPARLETTPASQPRPEAAPAARPRVDSPASTPDDRPSRLREAFFDPISPFLVRTKAPNREPGRVLWADCERVWSWLARDLARAEIDAALPADPASVSELRGRILGLAVEAMNAVVSSTSGQKRLSGRIGAEDGFTILQTVLAAFGHADWVANVSHEITDRLTREAIDRRPGLLAPIAAGVDRRARDSAWLYSALLSRLDTPTTLARIAVLLANTDRDEELARTPHAPAIDIFLSEIELEIERVRALREARAPVADIEKAIARYRQFARELSIEVDLKPNSRWTRRLAAAKVSASAQLEQEIARADELTRQVLGSRLASGDMPALDAGLLADAERALRILNIAAGAAEALTLNAAVATARRDIDRAFEALIDPLINALRVAHGEERARLLEWCDGAIRLAGIYHGPDFGAILQRSRNVAISGRARVPLGA